MQSIKRWLPFIIIIVIIAVSIFYMSFNKQVMNYRPKMDSPKNIYSEACQHCHGDQGQGTGILYPGFDSDELSRESIEGTIKNGGFLMPAYPFITGDTLSALIDFIMDERYKPSNP